MTEIREDDTVLFKPKGRLRPGTVITACGTTLMIEWRGERYIRHRRDVTLVPSSRKWCNLRATQSPDSRVQRIHSAPYGPDHVRYHQDSISPTR